MTRYSQYPFGNLDMGEWFFIGDLDDDEFERLRKAAAMYAWRHNKKLEDAGKPKVWRFRIRRGSHEGKVGAWCQRIDIKHGAFQKYVDYVYPTEEQLSTSAKPKWPVDEAHYHGEVSFILPGDPGSRELANAATSVETCVRKYEKRTGTKYRITHRLTEQGFEKTITRIDNLQE